MSARYPSISFLIAGACCFSYGFFYDAISRIPGNAVLLFFIVSTLAFFHFSFPISDDRTLGLKYRLSRFVIHSLLAVGYGFFMYIFHNADRAQLEIHDLSRLIFQLLLCFSVGVFVYYFFNVSYRLYLNNEQLVRIVNFAGVAAICFTASVLDGVSLAMTILYALSSIIIFCGIYPYIAITARVMNILILSKLQFDAFVLAIGVTVFFMISYLFIKDPNISISYTIFIQIVILLVIWCGFLLIDSTYVLRKWWLARFEKNAPGATTYSEKTNNDDTMNFSLYVLRYLVGPLSNFSILLSPISLISYIRYSMFLDEIEKTARPNSDRLSIILAVGACLIYVLVIVIFSIQRQFDMTEPLNSITRGFIFVASAAIAWTCLSLVDNRHA
jgi:hypothetical protein